MNNKTIYIGEFKLKFYGKIFNIERFFFHFKRF